MKLDHYHQYFVDSLFLSALRHSAGAVWSIRIVYPHSYRPAPGFASGFCGNDHRGSTAGLCSHLSPVGDASGVYGVYVLGYLFAS